jgi:hypothetical protein
VPATLDNLVGISVAYSTLSTTEISQVISQGPTDLTGNLAGMIGTLTGIDAVKTIVMFVAIFYGWFHERNFDPFFDMIG